MDYYARIRDSCHVGLFIFSIVYATSVQEATFHAQFVALLLLYIIIFQAPLLDNT